MPLVTLKVSYRFKRDLLDEVDFIRSLRPIVAEALGSEEDGSVSEDSIAVLIREVDPVREPGNSDVMILILAHDYPSRKANLEARATIVRDWLRGYFVSFGRQYTGGVWLLLAPSAYLEL